MRIRLFFALSLIGLGAWAVQPPTPAQERSELPQGVEVVTRGLVHEAFAEPGQAAAQEFGVVPRRPPDPIEELPPEQRPAGDEVVWISGFWAWDDDSRDFLWVSGLWREEPPDRHWVPGFWQEVEGGWHRVSGFWASDKAESIQYLPPPPELIPESVPPTPNQTSIQVPGTWVYHETRYAWRPGFYVDYRPGWVYVPARYSWTPGGYVFVDGYWDHPLHRRGLLFAPLRVAQGTVVRNFRYVPSYAIYPDVLLTSLFVRPATRAYYFGDYFDNNYARAGYVPWVDYRISRTAYDPNFAYYRQTFHNNRRWETDLRNTYVARTEGRAPRPPRTLAQQTQVIQTITNTRAETNAANIANIRMAAPLTQINNAQLTLAGGLVADAGRAARPTADNVLRLQAVSADSRQQFERTTAQYRDLADRRRAGEQRLIREGDALRAGEQAQSLRLEVPRRTADAGRPPRAPDRAPPPAPAVPQPNHRGTPDQPKAQPPVRPGVDRPKTEPPVRSGTDRPKADRPATTPDRPRTEPPRPIRPGTDRPGTDQPKAPPVERPRDVNPPPRPGDPARPPAAEPPANPARPKTEPPVNPARPKTEPSVNPARPKTEPPVNPARPKTEPPVNPARPKTEPPANPARPKTEPPVNPANPPRPVPPDRPKTDPPTNPATPPRPVPPDRPKAEPPPRPVPPDRPKAEPPTNPVTPPRPVPPNRPKAEPPAKERPKDKQKEKDKGKDGGA